MISMRRMHQKSYLLLVACLAVVAPLLSGCVPTQPECGQDAATSHSGSNQAPRGCTIFTVSQGERVFFGGNGDWIRFLRQHWGQWAPCWLRT